MPGEVGGEGHEEVLFEVRCGGSGWTGLNHFSSTQDFWDESLTILRPKLLLIVAAVSLAPLAQAFGTERNVPTSGVKEVQVPFSR